MTFKSLEVTRMPQIYDIAINNTYINIYLTIKKM